MMKKTIIAAASLLSLLLIGWVAPKPIHAPSEPELRLFLWLDDTNLREFKPIEYVCLSYARDLKRNALRQGINMCLLLIDLLIEEEDGTLHMGGGHAVNGVVLANGTLIAIEPQTDQLISYKDLEIHVQRFIGLPNLYIYSVKAVW